MRTDPVVLARKRKSVSLDCSTKSPKVKGVVQRGIVNWAPPAIDGEDETSCKAHTMCGCRRRKRKGNTTTPWLERRWIWLTPLEDKWSMAKNICKGYRRKIPLSFRAKTGMYIILFRIIIYNVHPVSDLGFPSEIQLNIFQGAFHVLGDKICWNPLFGHELLLFLFDQSPTVVAYN